MRCLDCEYGKRVCRGMFGLKMHEVVRCEKAPFGIEFIGEKERSSCPYRR